MNLAQLEILQEVVTFAVSVPFAVLFIGQTPKLDSLWESLCVFGAGSFIFRS